MTFREVIAWFTGLIGRELHMVVYVAGTPVMSVDGTLGEAVPQDLDSREERGTASATQAYGEAITFDIGSATLGLAEELFASAEQIGSSIAVTLVDGAEVVAFPWREPER